MAKKSSKKKYNKEPKPLYVPKEERYLRGIVMAVITLLSAMIMCRTLAIRLVSVLFVAAGMSNKRIALLVGCSTKTVRSLRRDMETKEVCELLTIKKGSGRPPKASANVAQQIIDIVIKGRFSTLKQIACRVKKSLSLNLSKSAIGRFLKKFNIRKLKCGSLPSKADPVAQRTFYADVLHPLMVRAKKNECVLLFLDASHFVMGCDFLGCFYGLYRKFIATKSGRKRYNVLGALNFISKAVHTVTNDTYITSKQVCRMLAKIAKAYPKQDIHVVLDNAAYQRCKLVQNMAEKLGIHLEFLPPYSPNLNLIERFWKFVKGELRTSAYDDFSVFSARIDEIVASSVGENKTKVDELIGEKVQLFDNLEKVSENLFEQRNKSTARKEENTQAA